MTIFRIIFPFTSWLSHAQYSYNIYIRTGIPILTDSITFNSTKLVDVFSLNSGLGLFQPDTDYAPTSTIVI